MNSEWPRITVRLGNRRPMLRNPFTLKREREKERKREKERGGRRGREERANGSNPASRFAALRARKMAVSRKEAAGET